MGHGSVGHDSGTGRTVRRWRRVCLRSFFVVLLLGLPSSAWALSLYDVVELSRAGYSDKQIIELIEKTRSRFKVDASAVIKLKESGVSEEVIRELLKASTTDSPLSTDTDTPSGSPTTDPQDTRPRPDQAPGPHSASDTHDPVHANGPFSSFPSEKIQGGHAGSHQHQAVAVRGVNMIILRSEAGHRSIAHRAGEITARLNRAVTKHPFGTFYATREPDATVWYRPNDTNEPIRILTADRGDVIGYQRRSLGRVSENRVAAYWAALLDDYAAIFLFERAPTRLVGLHLGEVLNRVYEELASSTPPPGKESIDDNTWVLRILDHLSAEDKEHLLELAKLIPAEFVQDTIKEASR